MDFLIESLSPNTQAPRKRQVSGRALVVSTLRPTMEWKHYPPTRVADIGRTNQLSLERLTERCLRQFSPLSIYHSLRCMIVPKCTRQMPKKDTVSLKMSQCKRIIFSFWISFILTNAQLNYAVTNPLFNYSFKSYLCSSGRVKNASYADISVIFP